MRLSALAKEIKKRGPFESSQQEAYVNLVRTAAILTVDFERLFRGHGLSGAHYNVLRILAGEKAGGVDSLPVLEVRNRLVTPMPDITRLVDKLIERRLVRRDRTESDRRVVLLQLTDRGQNLLDALRDPVRQLHLRQLDHLTRAELETLSRLLEKARSKAAAP